MDCPAANCISHKITLLKCMRYEVYDNEHGCSLSIEVYDIWAGIYIWLRCYKKTFKWIFKKNRVTFSQSIHHPLHNFRPDWLRINPCCASLVRYQLYCSMIPLWWTIIANFRSFVVNAYDPFRYFFMSMDHWTYFDIFAVDVLHMKVEMFLLRFGELTHLSLDPMDDTNIYWISSRELLCLFTIGFDDLTC